MKTHIEKRVGDLLKKLRNSERLALTDVCYKIRMAVDTLAEIESGRQHIPIHRIEQLCNIYGVTLVNFFKQIAEEDESETESRESTSPVTERART